MRFKEFRIALTLNSILAFLPWAVLHLAVDLGRAGFRGLEKRLRYIYHILLETYRWPLANALQGIPNSFDSQFHFRNYLRKERAVVSEIWVLEFQAGNKPETYFARSCIPVAVYVSNQLSKFNRKKPGSPRGYLRYAGRDTQGIPRASHETYSLGMPRVCRLRDT